MSKFGSILAEAAYTMAGHGFTEGEYGNVETADGYNALCIVSPVLLLNLGEDELAEKVREVTEEECYVWFREDSQGFVDRMGAGDEWVAEAFEKADAESSEFDPSRVLAECDPIAYRVAWHDYCDAEGWE